MPFGFRNSPSRFFSFSRILTLSFPLSLSLSLSITLAHFRMHSKSLTPSQLRIVLKQKKKKTAKYIYGVRGVDIYVYVKYMYIYLYVYNINFCDKSGSLINLLNIYYRWRESVVSFSSFSITCAATRTISHTSCCTSELEESTDL